MTSGFHLNSEYNYYSLLSVTESAFLSLPSLFEYTCVFCSPLFESTSISPFTVFLNIKTVTVLVLMLSGGRWRALYVQILLAVIPAPGC